MLSEDLPPVPLAEIGRYRRLKTARERGLVAAAMDLPHWIVRQDGVFVLFVEEGVRDRVATALAEFEKEERERVRAPNAEPLKIPKLALAVTLGVMALCYLAQVSALPQIIERGVADDTRILRGEWWRTLTALTLHGGIEHLVSNLSLAIFAFAFVLWRFGVGVGLLGTVLGGALGNLMNAFAHAGNPHTSIGSSTALFASLGLLAGAELAARMMHRETRSAWQLLVPIGAGFAFLALYGGGGVNRDGTPVSEAGSVDVMAHFFGLGAGIVIGGILFAVGARNGASRFVQLAAGGVAVGLLVAGWALAFRGS